MPLESYRSGAWNFMRLWPVTAACHVVRQPGPANPVASVRRTLQTHDVSERDEPDRRPIYTRSDWDRVVTQGELTPDDVEARLHRIAVREFGELGPAGYDEEGFFTSLTAEGLRLEGGVTLFVHTNDHPPPHVHVRRRGHEDVKINLETGAVEGKLPSDVRQKQLNGFRSAVSESFGILGAWWERYHGDPVTRTEAY